MGTEKPIGVRHKATYASDKRLGGYLIRVVGPDADKFIDYTVPVTTRNGDVHNEKLTRLVWAGVDIDSGSRVALYHFESKPRETSSLEF